MSSNSVSLLSDDALLGAARALAQRARVLDAELLLHLHEVEQRKLHLQMGFSSMYAYCKEELGFSEDAAYNRLEVARVVPHFPQLLDVLRNKRVHLTGLRLLARHLTKENFDSVIADATGKTKREIEALCVRLVPQEPVADSIRRLPVPTVRPSVVPALAPVSENAAPPPALALTPPAPPTVAPETVASLQRARRPRIDPLAPDAHRVQFTADDSLVALIEETRALHRHAVPDGDLATLIRSALTLYNAQLRKRRYGAAAVRETKPEQSPEARPELPVPSLAEAERPATSEPEGRYIPVSKRGAVYAKNGGRCAYVGRDGRRCEATAWLEFEHRKGYARTHRHDVETLALYCKPHNQLAADELFGREFMDEKRAGGRRPQDEGTASPSTSTPVNPPRLPNSPRLPRGEEQCSLFALDG